MNFSKIENLVLLCKRGDTKAKEKLVEEFTPFILNLSKKSYVNGFEFEDLKNECYKTLFKCVQLYNVDRHRFVAYATNAIKNSINHLIRTTARRENSEGPKALILSDNLEHVLSYDMEFVEDEICKKILDEKLKAAIESLTLEEKDLIEFVYYKKNTLKKYASYSGIPYSKVISLKNNILIKLNTLLTNKNTYTYLI